MSPPENLTEDQAAVYDRQLRVWGHEVQHRLTAAKLLIIGGDGLAAEIAKNLVLAGVGHVALADGTPCSQAPFGNFLVAANSQDPMTVAEASMRTLSEMNPLISCSVLPLGPCKPQAPLQLQSEQLASYDLIVSCCGISCTSADDLEKMCADAGKQLYIAELLGHCAYAYINLGPNHQYTEKAAAGQQQGDGAPPPAPVAQVACYPRLTAALSRPVSQCLGRRPIHALYPVLRVVRAFEAQHGRPASTADDLPALQAVAREMESKEGAPSGSVSDALLEAWVLDRAGTSLGSAPTAAMAGGVLANSIVRAISRVGAPLKNWFFLSLADGAGYAEDIDGPVSK